MSLLQLFKAAFVKPTDLLQGKDKSGGKVFIYFLFLTLIMSIPLGVELIKVVGTMQKDVTAITDKMPEFSTKDNQLTTDTPDSGFIYQTDYLIFTFDPDGKRDQEDLQNDLIGNVIGLGLLKEEIILTVTDDNLMGSLLPSRLLKIPYSRFDNGNLTKEWILKNVASNPNLVKILIIAFSIALLPIAFDLLLTIVMMTLVGNLFIKMRRSQLKLTESFKIIVFSATIPAIVSTLLLTFFPMVNASFVMMLMTLMIYLKAVPPAEDKPTL